MGRGGGRKAEPGRISFSGSSIVKHESRYGRVGPAQRAGGKESGRSYVTEPISVKLQVKKGWTCTEGWRDRAR